MHLKNLRQVITNYKLISLCDILSVYLLSFCSIDLNLKLRLRSSLSHVLNVWAWTGWTHEFDSSLLMSEKGKNETRGKSIPWWFDSLNIHFVSSWEMLLWFYRGTLSNFSLERQELCFHSSPNLQTYYSPNIQVSSLKKHFFYGCRKRVLEPRSTFAWSRIDFQKLCSSASTQLQESMSLQYKEVFWG